MVKPWKRLNFFSTVSSRPRIRMRPRSSWTASITARCGKIGSSSGSGNWPSGFELPGRPLQLEPMNSYERRIVHNAFKDDPDVATWSPSDSARIKQITLVKRQSKKEPAQKEGGSLQTGRASARHRVRPQRDTALPEIAPLPLPAGPGSPAAIGISPATDCSFPPPHPR